MSGLARESEAAGESHNLLDQECCEQQGHPPRAVQNVRVHFQAIPSEVPLESCPEASAQPLHSPEHSALVPACPGPSFSNHDLVVVSTEEMREFRHFLASDQGSA